MPFALPLTVHSARAGPGPAAAAAPAGRLKFKFLSLAAASLVVGQENMQDMAGRDAPRAAAGPAGHIDSNTRNFLVIQIFLFIFKFVSSLPVGRGSAQHKIDLLLLLVGLAQLAASLRDR